MERITYRELPDLFQDAADTFGEKKEGLCEINIRVGDGGLGLTMQKGSGTLSQPIQDNEAEGDVREIPMKAGMKMAALVPSTMGTPVSNGVVEGGRAIGEKEEMGSGELVDFLVGFARGIAYRGKCQSGDRTILDAVDAGTRKAQEACAEGADMGAMLRRVAEDTEEGVKAIEGTLPRHGKAAVFPAKAKGIPDQGAVAGQCSPEGLGKYFL